MNAMNSPAITILRHDVPRADGVPRGQERFDMISGHSADGLRVTYDTWLNGVHGENTGIVELDDAQRRADLAAVAQTVADELATVQKRL